MKRMAICAVALLALAACGKKDAATSAGGASADASATASPAAAPKLMTPPERKAGLWEQTMHMAQMTQTSKICFDGEVNKKMSLWGQQAGKDMCSQQSVTPKLGGGWTFSSTCQMGSGGTIHSEGEATGDFNSHYTVKVKSSTTGASAPQMNGEHEMLLEATWKGPCPADFKPGDMELSNGMKMNILTLAASTPGGPGKAPSAAQMAAMRKQMEAAIKAQHDGR
jgi:hypothetical protein